MEEIAEFCERVVVMHKGSLVLCDTTSNIFSRYEELRNYNLDIPKITELFRVFQSSSAQSLQTILTVDEAQKYITAMINSDSGGAK
jgi:ABC-type multidrug transport system ATPase subunit